MIRAQNMKFPAAIYRPQTLSEFKQRKLEEEAKKHWDKFYMRNETRFFKDRHWTTREFEELLGQDFQALSTDNRPTLLEVLKSAASKTVNVHRFLS